MSAPAVAPRTSLILIIAAFFLGVGAYAALGACPGAEAMGFVPVLAFALAACIALSITPFAMYLSFQAGLVNIDGDHPTPTLGGPPVLVAFAIAAVAGLAVLPAGAVSPELRDQLLAMLCGGALLTTVGVVHDKRKLSLVIRFVAQIAVAAVMVHFGAVTGLLPTTTLGAVGDVLLTVALIVGVTHAICYVDRWDGLASAVVMAAAIARGTLAISGGQPAVAITAFCLAGAAAGFLKYSFRPAAARLGNSGVMFLGYTLACTYVIGAGYA